MIIAARALGPEGYGVLILVHGYVATICHIVEFPAWQAIVHYGAQAVAGNAHHRLARLLRFGATVELGGGAVAIVVTMLLAPIAGPRLGWSETAQALAIPYSFAALGSIRSTPAGYLQLAGRFDLLGLHNLIAPAVRLGGAAIAASLGAGLRGFLIAWLLAALAEFVSLWWMGLAVARRHQGRALGRPDPGNVVAENPRIWRFLTASNADVTLSELAGRVAPLAVGWLLGPATAGLYAVAQRATVIISQPAQILGNTSYVELSRLVARGDGGATLRHALARVVGIALLAALPVLLIVAMFPETVARLLAGEAFRGAGVVMIWLVVARAIAMIGPPCSAALAALGRPGLSMTINLLASLVFLPLLVPLLDRWQLAGAGVQALLQASVTSLCLMLFVWRQSAAVNR
jgi:O-antigen/teichoic acid export membrane protein